MLLCLQNFIAYLDLGTAMSTQSMDRWASTGTVPEHLSGMCPYLQSTMLQWLCSQLYDACLMCGVEYMTVIRLFACRHVQCAHDTCMCAADTISLVGETPYFATGDLSKYGQGSKVIQAAYVTPSATDCKIVCTASGPVATCILRELNNTFCACKHNVNNHHCVGVSC